MLPEVGETVTGFMLTKLRPGDREREPRVAGRLVATIQPTCDAALRRMGIEIIAALNAAPDPDLFRRMEDAGVTGLVSYPLLYSLGPGSSIEQKRAALERYAEAFIARSR